MTQDVKHSFYKMEMNSFKAKAKYGYDAFGSMIDQHKEHKKPTVEKFIKKSEQDLQNQIRA